MPRTLEESREDFFSAVCREFPTGERLQLLLVTHLLEDRPVVVRNLAKCCTIGAILGIPYSMVPRIQQTLSIDYDVAVPALETLLNHDDLFDIASKMILKSDVRVAIMEIGGYFAPIGNRLKETFGSKFLGVIEDTESGHRRYEENRPLSFPVVSVARSALKMVEDTLIGPSVVFSVERILREMGQVLPGATVGVLGYGRIGSGIAREAARRGANVAIFDQSAIRRATAVADGFSCPNRNSVLSNSNILIGAAGRQSVSVEDFDSLKDGVVLASGSSKQVEFDVQSLKAKALKIDPGRDVERFHLRNDKVLFLIREGKPVNFRDGGVVGPAISLTQAELIVALKTLIELEAEPGIAAVSTEDRELLAEIWLDYFVDFRRDGVPFAALDFLCTP
jgi:adenosylhomocysteinase